MKQRKQVNEPELSYGKRGTNRGFGFELGFGPFFFDTSLEEREWRGRERFIDDR